MKKLSSLLILIFLTGCAGNAKKEDSLNRIKNIEKEMALIDAKMKDRDKKLASMFMSESNQWKTFVEMSKAIKMLFAQNKFDYQKLLQHSTVLMQVFKDIRDIKKIICKRNKKEKICEEEVEVIEEKAKINPAKSSKKSKKSNKEKNKKY